MEERVLESPDDLVDPFLDAPKLNFHLDGLLADGSTIVGTTWLLSEVLDVNWSDKAESKRDWLSWTDLESETDTRPASVALIEAVSKRSVASEVSGWCTPSADSNPFECDTSVRGVSNTSGIPGEAEDVKVFEIDLDLSVETGETN